MLTGSRSDSKALREWSYVRRIRHTLASLTRRAGFLLARHRPCPPRRPPHGPRPAGPRTRRCLPRPARSPHPSRGSACGRKVRGKGCGQEPRPPGCRTPSNCASVAGRTQPGSGSAAQAADDAAPPLVPVLLRGTRPGPLRHHPVRQVARRQGRHGAQVLALGHADLEIPARKTLSSRNLALTLVADRDRRRWRRPMPRGTVIVTDSGHPQSPATTYSTQIAGSV
jgi:hypothetical protein